MNQNESYRNESAAKECSQSSEHSKFKSFPHRIRIDRIGFFGPPRSSDS